MSAKYNIFRFHFGQKPLACFYVQRGLGAGFRSLFQKINSLGIVNRGRLNLALFWMKMTTQLKENTMSFVQKIVIRFLYVNIG